MRLVRLLAVALIAIAPLGALGTDPPHAAQSCAGCHILHDSLGGSLTKTAGNFNLCNSCHINQAGFAFSSWSTATPTVPGTGGFLHRFDTSATNATYGATPPSASSSDPGEVAMAGHLDSGNLKCSTCHDQHISDAFAVGARGAQHIQTPYRSAGTGTGTIAVTSAPSGLVARSYVIQITPTGGAVGTAIFRVSNDNKVSWVQSNLTTAASVTLADGVTLSFSGSTSGSFVLNDEWSLYVSYPFVRADDTDGKMCTICHKARNQTWQNVEGTGPIAGTGQAVVLGQTVFSHPVNQALAKSYDKTVGANGPILDADGAAQPSATDANPTNDLVTGTGGIVTCLTCHHLHNADSSSLTVDPR